MTAKEYKELVDKALAEQFRCGEDIPVRGLAEAMRYSLLAGGKRVRPMLVLEFCRVAGGDVNAALPVACAIEMLHTYSLIHDDLPCMDDDELRRGRPTNHVVFGECTATLAGDALQAEAFGTILRCELPVERRVRCAMHLANAVGLDGMCGGQYLDMLAEGKQLDPQGLDEINSRKTGALLTAACLMGVAAAGGSPEQEEAAARYGAALGAAFQIRDDMLDVLSTEAELGKPIGSDLEEQKNTYMALYGEERCGQMVERLTAAAKSALEGRFADYALLNELADSMAVRRN